MSRIEGHADGELAEFAVAADLVGRYDCRVSYTHGSYRYDLIADHEDCLIRIQVKKANRDNDDPRRYKIFTEGYTPDEADVFAGYAVGEDKVFYETVEDANNEVRVTAKPKSEMSKHNARQANHIDDYTFDRAISRLCSNEESDGGL